MRLFTARRNNERPLCDLHWAGSKPDAHRLYAEAREQSPVCFDAKQDSWLVLGYEPAIACFKDTERLSNDPVAEFDPFVVGGDPPEHTRYRRILHDSVRAFDKAAVVAFAEKWLGDFLPRLRHGTPFDAVADLAVPLVDDLAGAIVGLTTQEIAYFKSLRPQNRSHVRAFDDVAWKFFSELVRTETWRDRPGALGHLLRETQESQLSEQAAVSLLRLLWVGSTATSNLFNPSALLLLVRHPQTQAVLREDLSLVPSFVSEALRLEGPTTTVPRRAKSRIELCGQEILEGDKLQICILAANSDPSAFAEPEKIDLRRPATKQIAFGFGIHHCLGGYIARALAETVVARILQTFPKLSAAEPLESVRYEEGDLRGVGRLLLSVS